jgi:hypothetical protein
MATRAEIEVVLVRRCGALLTAAGLAITFAGANADLNDPIGSSIRQLGGTVASIAAVTDADVLTVSADYSLDALLDLCELRTLENISGNYALVDIAAGPESEKLSQVAAVIEKRIDRLSAKIEKLYGIGAGVVTIGALTLDFARHSDDAE